jgi:hypothetical protein
MSRRSLISLLVQARPRPAIFACRNLPKRTYATHSDRVPPSSGPSQNANATTTADLLRRLEAESRRRGGATGFGGRENVGPFPLGVGASGRKKMWRPWKELGVSGKCESTFSQA